MTDFSRWSERARTVITLAQDCVYALNHDAIGTEHLLFGLAQEQVGVAARVLAELGIDAALVQRRIEEISGRGEQRPKGRLPFSERAEKVCDMALREALSMGHNYIGTEHVLLALSKEHEGDGSRILLDFNADSERIRTAVVAALRGPRYVEPTRTAQDVIDALRFALTAQDDPDERLKLVDALLDIAPETDGDQGVKLVLDMIAECSLKVALV